MGEAGFGAEEQASRRARRVAQLRAEQERGTALDAEVQAQLARAQRDQRAWSAGAEGERLVAVALESLDRYGWTALHDLHWPGRPKANLDHVALGPGGVVLVDAKNWSGDVTGVDGRLRQNGYDRTSQVESVAAAVADLVAQLAPNHRSAVRGIVCLASQDLDPTSFPWGVTVVGRAQLPAFLASMPPRLTPFDVADLGRYLQGHLGGATSPGVTATSRPPRRTRQRSAQVSVRADRPQRGSAQRRAAAARRQQKAVRAALLRVALVGAGLFLALNLLPHLTGK